MQLERAPANLAHIHAASPENGVQGLAVLARTRAQGLGHFK